MANYLNPQIDRTFAALADPTRRYVLQRLIAEPDLSVSDLARPMSLKLPGLLKHLDVLSDAGLILRVKAGRTVRVSLAAEPMQQAVEWLNQYQRFWSASLDQLAAFVEAQENS
jgi:DNA-binding transcriptional ArsR family regulator